MKKNFLGHLQNNELQDYLSNYFQRKFTEMFIEFLDVTLLF